MIVFVAASVFCSLMSKIMVTRYFFDYPVVILMMQSAATLFVIEVTRYSFSKKFARSGILDKFQCTMFYTEPRNSEFKRISRVLGILKVAPYCFEKGRHIVIPSILYTISQWITVASFEGIAMPNFDSVKRLTPILILVGLAARNRQQRVDQNKTFIIIGLSIASAFAGKGYFK